MKKAKTVTKHFLRGLRSSKEESESTAPVEPSNHSPKQMAICSTASQSVEASSSTHGTTAKQTSTSTIRNNDEHAEHIADMAGSPEPRSSNFNPSSSASAALLSTSAIQTPESTLQESKGIMAMPSRISRSLTELDVAMTEFRQNYELFAKKHPDVFLLNDEFSTAFRSVQASDDINRSAQIFGDGIWAVLQTMETKKDAGKSAWLTKLGTFLTKVTSFLPLKGIAGGLGIVLQIIGNELERSDEFLCYLQRIEFQAALLTDNPKYDLNDPSTSRNLIQEKAISLMAAIIAFFNSALIYFATNFFSKIGKTVVDGSRTFEDGKSRLDMAIREYEQAVFHLTAHVVADLKYNQEMSQKQKKDEELLKWLSGPFESPWLVEGQLSLFRRQRAEATLEWARDMPEFQTWRLSEPDKDRYLWIRGTLGVGKSVMAAYFIDLLKCHYSKAIVAYFFCRSNQPGLTTARDIIRTLAYQCIENDEDAHSILHELKRKGFGISENQEVDFLLEKLLLDPLRGTRKEIYIILDGVDEADMITANPFDRSGIPEMHVLLKSLTKLPFVRLLFISRGSANISNIVPNTTVKTIGKSENSDDIRRYVQESVAKSKQLRTLFENENKDPGKYFEEKADGIFLWVVLVIQQLEKAKTQSNFRKYLEGFSEASGSMERLYRSILLRIDVEYQIWVKEIIRWIVVAETRLSVEDLKNVVEFSVDDKFADFEEFLKVDCGSILQIIPETDGPSPDGVQLIHETFRSFVLNSEKCPPTFAVVEAESHGHVALSCLKRLSASDGSDTLNKYWASFWVDHLSKATSPSQSKTLLVNLHIIFTSGGLNVWIKNLELRPSRLIGLQVVAEEKALQQIRDWLDECRVENFAIDDEREEGPELVEAAINWRRTILHNIYALGESIGKAAARIWLYEPLDQVQPLITCFRLALKYFWKRANRTETNRDELNQLVDTEFGAISTWAETQDFKRIVKKNIALALLIVYRWDDCIRCFDADVTYDGAEFREVLATAYMAKREFVTAIDVLETAVAFHPTKIPLLYYLSNAAFEKGDYGLAIKTLETVLENEPNYHAISGLWKACDSLGDYDTAIKAYNLATSKNPSSHISWSFLGRAHAAKGDINGLFETFMMAIKRYPKEKAVTACIIFIPNLDSARLSQLDDLVRDKYPDQLMQLVIVHVINKDFDGALKIMETLIDQCSGKATFHWSVHLLWVCKERGDYDSAIKMVETSLQDRPNNSELWSFLGDAYMVKRDRKKAIAALERAIKGDDSYHRHIARSLFNAYRLEQDYEAAIKLAEGNADGKNNFGADFWLSRLLEVYYAKGDYDGAITLFETFVNTPNQIEFGGWSALLKAYVAKSGHRVAIKRIETAINESQISVSGSLAYGIFETFKNAGDYVGAIEWFSRVVDSRPTDGWAWNFLADVYVADGQYHKAIDTYHAAIKQISIDYSFYLRLGDVCLATSDEKGALDAYTKAIDMSPNPVFQWAYIDMRPIWFYHVWEPLEILIDNNLRHSFLWHSLGEVHKRTGNFDVAINVYESAVICYRKAIENGGLFLLQYSEIAESYGSFDVFQARPLEKAFLWSALGEVYRAMGKVRDALAAFQKALELKPDNSWLQGLIHEMSTESLLNRFGNEGTGEK